MGGRASPPKPRPPGPRRPRPPRPPRRPRPPSPSDSSAFRARPRSSRSSLPFLSSSKRSATRLTRVLTSRAGPPRPPPAPPRSGRRATGGSLSRFSFSQAMAFFRSAEFRRPSLSASKRFSTSARRRFSDGCPGGCAMRLWAASNKNNETLTSRLMVTTACKRTRTDNDPPTSEGLLIHRQDNQPGQQTCHRCLGEPRQRADHEHQGTTKRWSPSADPGRSQEP